MLEYAFGAATVCSGWSGYVLSLGQDFWLRLPPELAGTPGSVFVLFNGHWEFLGRVSGKLHELGIDPATLPQRHGIFNLIAFLGIMLVTTILVIGVKESANFNSFIVVVKLVVLLIFLGLGSYTLLHHPELPKVNLHPFLPPNTGTSGRLDGRVCCVGRVLFSSLTLGSTRCRRRRRKRRIQAGYAAGHPWDRW